MSKEFEKLKELLSWSEPRDWEPQVDRGEAAKLAARWSWLLRRVREERAELPEIGSRTAAATSDRRTPRQGDDEFN